jgi:cytochrome c6
VSLRSRIRLAGGAVLLGGVALTLSGTSAGMTKSSQVAGVTIKVTIRDASFLLSKKTAPAGKVTFAVKNTGKLSHTFGIAGKKTPVLKTGKEATLAVTFTKAAKYVYTSTIVGQASKGLKGTFIVTAALATTPGNAAAGKTVFTTAGGCSSCHTLAQADAKGTIGPNLDLVKLPYATILATVTNGKSGSTGTMPSFKGTLSTTQLQDVAAFIYAAEHPS